MSRAQRGQAIVLVALVITVLCGMLGLAIDGGRAFVDRREIQNAADAAAAAGAATYTRDQIAGSPNFANAEKAAVKQYEYNRNLAPGSENCPGGYPAPGSGATVSTLCTFSSDSSQTLTISVQDMPAPVGIEIFRATGTHDLLTEIIQVIGSANNVNISASGCAATGHNNVCGAIPPVVLALNAAGCGGAAGDALTINGTASGVAGSEAAVVGNAVSYGDNVASPSQHGGAGSIPIAGEATAACGVPTGLTPWCYPSGQNPATASPACTAAPSPQHYGRPAAPVYNTPPVLGPVAGDTALNVNWQPGTSTLPNLGTGPYPNGCYFLAGGVYNFQQEWDVQGGIVSNELRPPDEPDLSSANGDSARMSPQFWNQNGASCAGSFALSTVLDPPGGGLDSLTGGTALPAGLYAIKLTSVRTDLGVTRESAPSMCRTLNIGVPGTALQLSISNVPGAQAYDIYMSTAVTDLAGLDGVPNDGLAGTCADTDGFFLIGQVPVPNPQLETNADTTGCGNVPPAATCSLNVTVESVDLTPVQQMINDIKNGQVPPTPNIPLETCVPGVTKDCFLPPPAFQAPAGSGMADRDLAITSTAPPLVSSNPDRTAAYDWANWGLCESAASVAYDQAHPTLPNQPPSGCPNTSAGYAGSGISTPGAIQLRSSVACLNFEPAPGNDRPLAYLFSGYQYDWLVAADSASCSVNTFSPAFGSAFMGHIYLPDATNAIVTGNNPYMPTVYGDFTGQTVTVDGSCEGPSPGVVGAGCTAVWFIPPAEYSALPAGNAMSTMVGYGTAEP